MTTTANKSTGEINELRNEALARIGKNTVENTLLAEHVATLDTALMSATERNIDELQSLVTAAGKLAALIDGSAVAR